MNININPQRVSYDIPKVVERIKPNQGQTKQSTENIQAIQVESYTPSEHAQTIERLKAESEKHYEQLIALVKQLLERQGYTLADAQARPIRLEVDEATQLEAQASISEGREHSVEMVSDRLVEFAIAISGGDRSKLETLKGAIQEGFRQAEAAFGGTLPEISYQTLEATMQKLDHWAAEDQR